MTLVQMLTLYLNINLLIIVGVIELGLISLMPKVLKRRWAAVSQLKVHYLSILGIFCFALMQPLLPRNAFFSPAAKVWAAESAKSFGRDYSTKNSYINLNTPIGSSTLQTEEVTYYVGILFVALLCLGGFFLIRDLKVLFRIQKNSFTLKRLGKVRILINEHISVPFSFWLSGQANIVVPSSLIENPKNFRIAVAHELQHHRQFDTRWVFAMLGLKWFCAINPLVHLWMRWISQIQEFACDETLVDHGKVESQAYARCLLEVAQTAINQKRKPACATGLIFMVESNFLKRRIEKMFTKRVKRLSRKSGVLMGLVLISILGATAFASKGLIQDRRVNMTQAKEMANRAQNNSTFPIVVNDLVLKQLNRYMGTPEGRRFMRESLARMNNYKATVSDYLVRYNVPQEIMALPLVESGYQNLPESKNSAWPTWKAAGIWQFIASTARNFGLTVNSKQDDRMNVALLTDAAMRYLLSNQLKFNDWQLAILAYNIGEGEVQKGIEAEGTRDAWALIRKGYENDKEYLSKVMAAIIIMRNPESVE